MIYNWAPTLAMVIRQLLGTEHSVKFIQVLGTNYNKIILKIFISLNTYHCKRQDTAGLLRVLGLPEMHVVN